MDNTISIIIPVYNVSKYLEHCLDSVIKQSYNDLEIIIVDDGSTDGSSEICDKYAQIDSRIKVYHQSNRGVSNARNNGLKVATGKYVCIIDSDDYISPDYISVLENYMRTDYLDLVACGVFVSENEDGTYEYINGSEDDSLLNNRETVKLLFSSNGFKGWGVNKMYSLKIINENSIKFNEDIKYCEDELFCLEYIMHVKRAKYIKEVLYHYMLNLSSVNHLMYQKKQFNYNALDRLKADEICCGIVKSLNDVELNVIFNSRRFISNRITIDKLLRNYNGDKDTLSLLTSNLRKYLRYYLIVEHVSFKNKIGAVILSISPSFFYWVIKYRKNIF